MKGTGSTHDGAAQQGRYFFLSYAHSPPLAGSFRNLDRDGPQDPDQWVSTFFHDLSTAVDSRRSRDSGLAPGFFDRDVPVGSDWKAALIEALGSAEVFVPLYSPGYFAQSLPGREWACFQERMKDAGLESPLPRMVPVLWIPVPGEPGYAGLQEARAIGADDGPYRENGLRALLRLRPYHASYQQIVDRVATRILDIAERAPLRPSTVPDIDAVASAFKPEDSPAPFSVAVAAPTLRTIPAGRGPAGYGDRSVDWRPFGGAPETPAAMYVARVVEQLGFAVLETPVEKNGDLPTGRPGIILIDPWFIADDPRRRVFESLVDDLPSWVLPLVVLEPGANQRTVELAERVRTILTEAKLARTRTARRAIKGVNSPQGFVNLMPLLVVEAGRQYLRLGPIRRSKPRSGPRRLGGGPGPADLVPPERSRKEPDA